MGLGFLASNKEVEYEVTIFALREPITLGGKGIYLVMDSRLVANQYCGFSDERDD